MWNIMAYKLMGFLHPVDKRLSFVNTDFSLDKTWHHLQTSKHYL